MRILLVHAAIRGALDGDGWTCYRSYRVGLTCKSKTYVKDICFSLSKLGIHSYFRGPNKENKYCCEVTRKENLALFRYAVGFQNSKRMAALNRLVARYDGGMHANNNAAQRLA